MAATTNEKQKQNWNIGSMHGSYIFMPVCVWGLTGVGVSALWKTKGESFKKIQKGKKQKKNKKKKKKSKTKKKKYLKIKQKNKTTKKIMK